MSKLPEKISPCPILEVTVEIRFSSSFHHSAILGVFYNIFKDEFPTVESLPITQIPEEVRLNDPNFKFKVFNKLIGEIYTIQIGYDVITLHCNEPYVGWDIFSNEIADFLSKINSTNIINNIISVSLKYLNFFENNIFEKINVAVEVMGEKTSSDNSMIRLETPYEDNYIQVLQIANNTFYENAKTRIKRNGSILDISFVKNSPIDFFKKSAIIINQMHDKEKAFFFNILNEDFLNELNPTYSK